MSIVFTSKETMETVPCCSCGITFAMPETFLDKRREDHKWFYCPNGRSLSYSGESETEKLKKALELERVKSSNLTAARNAAQEQADHERRERKKMKTRHTNLRLRVKLGTCPCCNTQFENLKTHMANVHPYFTPTEDHKPIK